MIDFTDTKIEKLIVHRVGNKMKNEGITISSNLCDINNQATESIIQKYLLTPFNKINTCFRFNHENNIKYNEIYSYIKNIFNNEENFYKETVEITKHLYEKSTHPNIKNGELYIAYLRNCNIDNQNVNAIGIFKSENKDIFIDIIENRNQINVKWKKGTNINKLDKGCIVFNKNAETGYKILLVDNTNNREAKYWEEDFLNVTLIQDSFIKTKEIVNICKKFTEDRYIDDKKEKAIILNSTYEYLKENEKFETNDFIEKVVEKNEDKVKLKEYIDGYTKDKMDINEFNISTNAIKEIKREIKNLIKLDKTIEIKITEFTKEKANMIEKGYDAEKNMKYYKLYYNEES